MAMNTSQFQSITEPVLNTVFDGLYNELPVEWKAIFRSETALPRKFEEDTVLFGLGMAVEKPEGMPVTYDEGGEAYRVRYTHKRYALAFALTEEMVEDGEHIRIGSIYTRYLARGHREAEEVVHAAVFNGAFTNTGGDGVSLINTAHPLARGGTYSNALATPANLSEAALEQMLIQVRTMVDDRGNHIALKGRKLIVAPSNEYNAERILNSALRPGTANNDTNAMRNLGRLPEGVHVLTRLTNPNAYFIQTDAERGFVHKSRVGMKRGMEGDFETGNMRYKSSIRYSAGYTDPRTAVGTAGV